MATEEEGVIQQVELSPGDIGAELPEWFVLDIRGRKFRIKREELLSLPENILYCLSGGFGIDEAQEGEEGQEDVDDSADQEQEKGENEGEGEGEPVVTVDFNPDCFAYARDTIAKHSESLDPPVLSLESFREFRTPEQSSERVATSDDAGFGVAYTPDQGEDEQPSSPASVFELGPGDLPEIFQKRPALIVLREDLEYYCLPSSATEDLVREKIKVGELLGKNRRIFDGLRNRDNIGSPEFHLMQMLCLAGLESDHTWDLRKREPNRTTMLSLQLSPIKIPEDHNPEAIQALQKLLLFWKKPAKKCWWDNFNVDGHKVYARRIWTLEITILGVEA